eukprot:TRINITY_DN9100_c0_g2_i1.p1 TRINITY_DN9100_c0_g2~~TRINITY_DN9100_c0_g2_i1.p1  ORF type:complete len:114 (-),score=17.35 TRINITY_DN9100_c0_g2_i1:155-496(-)
MIAPIRADSYYRYLVQYLMLQHKPINTGRPEYIKNFLVMISHYVWAQGNCKRNGWIDCQDDKKQQNCAKGWIDLYQRQYPTAGILDKWSENTNNWPSLTSEELKELDAECLIM